MKTILAVDNDVDFLQEFEMALELYGYRVIINDDPSDAINQARQIKPDCILFDLKMPKKHGFQFSEEVKQDSTLRRIPTIAMTAFYNKDYDVCLDAFGISRCLKKPFSPDEAMKMIDSVLV
jgi:two-component system cell cycle response regulator DivK